MRIQLSKNLLRELDLSAVTDPNLYFYQSDEHYRMLAAIALQLPDGSKVADLGTCQGSSARAFSVNRQVRVDSYDIEKKSLRGDIPENVNLILKDATKCVAEFCDSKVILLDVDPHDGVAEDAILNGLLMAGYTGLLICDDIHLNGAMKGFWGDILLKKFDVTALAHWSGTGIVVFDENVIAVDIET